MHSYTPHMNTISQEINRLMQQFPHTKKDLGYGWRWTFKNGMWFDIIDYKKTDKILLRVGRGARLVKKYPILYSMFDDVKKVIAKFEIESIHTLEEKHVIGLFTLLHEAPDNIGIM